MKINDYLNASKNFEESKAEYNESRVKTFKLIAIIGIVFGILSLAALIVALPFKTLIPIVLEVDKPTGNTNIITTMTERIETVNEVVDKFNVARYVRAREGYIFDLVRHDFDLVVDQTNPTIVNDYISRYEGSRGRAEVLKDQVLVTPTIRSITLGESNGGRMATIRLILTRKDIRSGLLSDKHLIITLSYSYNNTAPMPESQRLQNPFGFMINAYRVDVEND